ncbi:MAG: hypothetical protein H5U15_00865 [Roseovarius sp.]|jgi:hypothetical protein|nr:hypothetical protein [Roseovarius sp.]
MAACPGRPKPPPLRDDCFALPAGVDWTPVDDVLALLRARIREGRAGPRGLVELAGGAAGIRPGDPVRHIPFASFVNG